MTKSLVLVVWALMIDAFALDTPQAPASVAAAAPGTTSVPVAATPKAAPDGPRIRFDSTVFDFGKAMAGELVKHQFYFTNTGNQDLALSNVQPQCGCTTTGEWTHQVKPGQSGVIPIQFNTANYNSPVAKSITVTSNDKIQPFLPLQLKGTVWKPVDINPQVVVLNLRSETPFGSGVVRITNSLDQPLWLSLPESNNRVFGAELKTNVPGRSYLVVVSNTTALPAGGTQGQITLKSSMTNLPVIGITAYASMLAGLTVSPAQIMLPASPLPTNQLARYVTIINNTTNPLTLSDLAVNAKDVRISTQTLQAGKYYTVTLAFPSNFEVLPGQPVVFTARTSNPQFEVVKVPISQLPPRAQAAHAPLPPPGPAVLKRPPQPPALPPASVHPAVGPPSSSQPVVLKASAAPGSPHDSGTPPLPSSQ
jgi:hypothetical protein